MPRYVDHEQRRRELIEVATELVVNSGRSALTVRNVAQAAGYSTKVVSHYFADIADLQYETYRLAARRAAGRVERVLSDDPADLPGFIEALLPLDSERARDWVVWFAFWSEALPSDRLRNDQAERATIINERLAVVLDLLVQRGRLSTTHDLHDAACRLGAIIQGLASQAIFDPPRWSAERQRAVLDSELLLLGVDPVPAGERVAAAPSPADSADD